MKKLAIFLSIICSFSTIANEIETVKVLDGRVAYCRNAEDQIFNRLGVYRLTGYDVEVIDGFINIDASVEFYKCVEQKGSFFFEQVGAYAPMSYKTIGSDLNEVDVTVRTKNIVLRSIIDGQSNILADISLRTRAPKSEVQFKIDSSKVITEEESLAMDNGLTVETAIDVFMLKSVTFQTEDGFESHDVLPAGSFRFHLKTSKDSNGQLKANLILK